MPRKKNPEYHRYFSCKVEGHGLTREQALHNYQEDCKYKCKWIKGTLTDGPTDRQEFQHSDGTWIIYAYLHFTQTRYLDDNQPENEETSV